MRKIRKVNEDLFLITAEPGDTTRYEYLVYRDGPDNFTIAPTGSTFRYPQRLNIWDIKNLTDDQVFSMAEKESCNPHTLREVINGVTEIYIGR